MTTPTTDDLVERVREMYDYAASWAPPDHEPDPEFHAALTTLADRVKELEREKAVQIERNRELHKLGAQQRASMEARAERAEARIEELERENAHLFAGYGADVHWQRAERAEAEVTRLRALAQDLYDVFYPHLDESERVRLHALVYGEDYDPLADDRAHYAVDGHYDPPALSKEPRT